MSQISIILYSEYSVNSKRIMDIINNPSVSHIFSVLERVCIDNEKVRKRIIKSKRIEITKVPCILIIYQDGGVEKYDGSHAFRWVEDIIQQNSPNQSAGNNVSKQENIVPSSKTDFDNEPTSGEIGFTSIDDLKSDDDEIVEEKPVKVVQKEKKVAKKPPKSIRTDVGNYEINTEFGDDDSTLENRNITSGLKSATSKDKGLIAVAQAMQKARETENPSEISV